ARRNRPPAQDQSRCLGCRPGDVFGSPSEFRQLSRQRRTRVRRLAAGNSGSPHRQSGSALCGDSGAGRAARGGARIPPRPFVAGARARPVRTSRHPQSACGAARAGSVARGGPGAPPRRVPRSRRFAAPRRTVVSRGGRAHGEDGGQRAETLGTGPGPSAATGKGRHMTDQHNPDSSHTVIDPPSLAGGAGADMPEDPRIVEVVQDYLAHLEKGEIPDRSEYVRRYPELATAVEQCLEGLDLMHAESKRLRGRSGGEGSAPKITEPAEPLPESLG